MKGLLVEVIRPASGYDATAGGVSSKAVHLVLVKNGAELGPFEPTPDSPALYLAKWCDRLVACPENLEEKYPPRPRERGSVRFSDVLGDRTIEYLGGWMFGGNFIYSSDGRFSAVSGYPIPIYDRKE